MTASIHIQFLWLCYNYPMIIRSAVPEDAPGLTKVRQQGWLFAYRGLMPDAILDQMDGEKETRRWKEKIAQPPVNSYLLCVEIDREVVGFCAGGKNRDADDVYDGEIYALYVLPDRHNQGIGRALVKMGMDWLRDRGYRQMLIWVLRDNQKARRFYEAVGGKLERERQIEIGGTALMEVGYGYNLSLK